MRATARTLRNSGACRTKAHALALAVLAGLGLDATAQSSRYESWSPQGSAATTTGESTVLIDELRALVEEAEKVRAADPRFLRDLRALIRRHDWPWRNTLLDDDFADGDYIRAPAWEVVSGGFRVEPGLGLRTLDRPAAASAPREEQSDDPGRDLAIAIIGSILQQQSGGTTRSTPAAAEESRGAIRTRVPVPNSFAVESVIRSGRADGRIEFAVAQGAAGNAGYRVVYLPGGTPSLELQRFGRRGAAVIAAHFEPLVLEDGQPHRMLWTRDAGGTMRVRIDGRDLLEAVDRAFRDPFAWVEVAHDGGAFAVGRVAVWGAR